MRGTGKENHGMGITAGRKHKDKDRRLDRKLTAATRHKEAGNFHSPRGHADRTRTRGHMGGGMSSTP